ncbi:MAG: T9SS type A sorting domain-containing protein [Flavobacteriales bacterium]
MRRKINVLIPLACWAIGILADFGPWSTATAQTDLPSLESAEARQVHYVLDAPTLTQDSLMSLGDAWQQQAGAMTFALISGTLNENVASPMEVNWNSTNTEEICVLRATRNWIASGTETEQWAVVPASTIPTTWDSIGCHALHFIQDGVDSIIELDEPFLLNPYPNGETQGVFKLELHLQNGTVQSGEVILKIRETCPVPLPDWPVWPVEVPTNPWWMGTFHNGTPVTGSALLRLGADGAFDQPLILCDGFDPQLHDHIPVHGHGDQNWETLWDCDHSYRSTLDSLYHRGVDVVFLDFADGTLGVQANAKLLQEVILICNTYKDSNAPLRLVGASMGGVIANLALREMELNGESHCVGLFVALDSPMQGAYLPWSLLQAIDFFSGISAEAEALSEALSSPAAQQLLFLTPNGVPVPHALLQNELTELGLPQQPICGALVNSHPNIDFPTLPGPLLQATESLFCWEYAHVQLNALPGDADHSMSTAMSHVTFDAQLPNMVWELGDPLIFSQISHAPSNSPSIESWPGSKTAHLEAFQSALEAGGISVTSCQAETMFIPTSSALHVPFTGDISSSPFHWIHTEPAFSGAAMHCDLTQHEGELLQWIDQAMPLNQTIFGHNWPLNQRIALDTTHINSLIIGDTGSNQVGSPTPVFEVRLAPCTDWIEIDSIVRIGDVNGNHPGKLFLESGQTLVINEGAQLHIGLGSQLIMESGAQIIWEEGSQAYFQGDLLIHDGTITLSPNAQVQWEMYDGKVQIWNAHCTMSTNSELNWNGNATPEEHFLEIFQMGSLQFSGTGLLNWSNGTTMLAESSTINFGQCAAHWQNCRIVGQENAIENQIPLIHLSARGRLHHSEIVNTQWTGLFSQPSAFRSLFSQWSDVKMDFSGGGGQFSESHFFRSHLTWDSASMGLSMSNNIWMEGHDDQRPLVDVSHCPEWRMLENQMSGHRMGLRCMESTAYLKCNELDHFENVLLAEDGGQWILNGPWGGSNAFSQNEIVWRCLNSPLPMLEGGQNEFQWISVALGMGTVWAQMGPGNLPAPHAAHENIWPPSGSPNGLWVPGFDWTACNPEFSGSPILVMDEEPSQQRLCGASTNGPSQEEDGIVKSKSNWDCSEVIWHPNPTTGNASILGLPMKNQSFRFRLFDSHGKTVETADTPWNQLNLSHLSSGVYIGSIEHKETGEMCHFHTPLIIIE